MIAKMPMTTGGLPGLLMVLALAGPVSAADADQVASARQFLGDEARAKAILFFMHPTAEYGGVKYVKQTGVVNAATGEARQGWFCLHYQFQWKSGLFNDANTTEALAFFNERGRLMEVQAGATSSFVKPFTAANIVIAAVKDEILKNVNGDDNKEKIVRALIEEADARGLLTFLLQLEQK
jgi:hypothetical protein